MNIARLHQSQPPGRTSFLGTGRLVTRHWILALIIIIASGACLATDDSSSVSSTNAPVVSNPVDFRDGTYSYPAKPKGLKTMGLPNPRDWAVTDDDWQLPENWKYLILRGLKERLGKFRSLQIFMDCCVRCGACADKCHFYIGSGDPKNMPVLRAELLRSVYRNEYSKAGKILGKWIGKLAGERELTIDVIKEWFIYFHQCTECRRCSVFCPYGIDTAEVTMMGRELLNEVGVNIDWIHTPVSNCY